jgi:uncharacterized repeat protein (TIGR02543 family)
MTKNMFFRTLLVLFSMAAVLLSENGVMAASPWPADATGTLIEVGTGYEPSGITWHTRLKKFFVVSDNGYVISMDADGTNAQYWNVGGDLEAVAIVDPASNYIYVGIENPDSIKEVDVTTGRLTGKTWDLTQWMTGPANSGLEALTFVPNGRHANGPGASGGLFYAGLQANGKVYVFDVDLARSGAVAFKDVVLTPASGKADISDMFYSKETNTIYAIFDSHDLLVEMSPDGDVMGEYTLPQPYRGQEGIVIVTSSPDMPARVYIAQDEAPEVWEYENFPVSHVMELSISSGSGGTTDPGPGIYLHDYASYVTVTAEPEAGYQFNGWSGAFTGTDNPVRIGMDENMSIAASFVPMTYTLSVSATNGSVALSPAGGVYTAGTVVTLTATPAAGYRFSGWSGAVTGTSNPAALTINGNRSVAASFVPITYTLNVSAANGSVTMSPAGGIYNAGTVVTLTATPAVGYQFSGWSGDLAGTSNPATVTMDGDRSVSANFAVIPVTTYKLTTSATNGSITLTPAGGTYSAGTVVTLKAVPRSAWYKFSGWGGDLTGKTNPTTITMNGNKRVTASFKFSFFPW